MTRDEAIAKARKVRALAERGDPGERDNAARMLAGLMEDHGLTDADLKEPEASRPAPVYEQPPEGWWRDPEDKRAKAQARAMQVQMSLREQIAAGLWEEYDRNESAERWNRLKQENAERMRGR